MDQRRWADLVPDVLREISSRVCLHSAKDFIYFHAVCKPWRNSHDPLSLRTTTTQFSPCLLAAANNESADIRFKCIFPRSCCCAMLPTPPRCAPSWVSTADGTEVCYLTVEHLRPTLHNPFTGKFTDLPLFPHDVGRWEEERLRGIICGDGTTFLYNLLYTASDTARFRAALLHPGSSKWTVIERIFVAPRSSTGFCAAYYEGKIVVVLGAAVWPVIRLDGGVDAGDVEVSLPYSTLCEWEYYSSHYSFILESRGELLGALVQVEPCYHAYAPQSMEYFVSFWLHALEEEASSPEKNMRWVKKDGGSLADRVLFLGTPNSFAVDASSTGDQDGGCAYFILYKFGIFPEKVGVWRCNLISNKSEFVERLPQGWNDGRCTWHVPQPPTIAPIQELMNARELKQPRQVTRNDVVPSAVSYMTKRNTEKYVVPAMRNEGKKQAMCCSTSKELNRRAVTRDPELNSNMRW